MTINIISGKREFTYLKMYFQISKKEKCLSCINLNNRLFNNPLQLLNKSRRLLIIEKSNTHFMVFLFFFTSF